MGVGWGPAAGSCGLSASPACSGQRAAAPGCKPWWRGGHNGTGGAVAAQQRRAPENAPRSRRAAAIWCSSGASPAPQPSTSVRPEAGISRPPCCVRCNLHGDARLATLHGLKGPRPGGITAMQRCLALPTAGRVLGAHQSQKAPTSSPKARALGQSPPCRPLSAQPAAAAGRHSSQRSPTRACQAPPCQMGNHMIRLRE